MRNEMIQTRKTEVNYFNENDIDESMLQADLADIKISGLSLAQGKHPAIKTKIADEGDYVDTVTNKNYGQQIDIIVLKHSKTWILKEDQKFIDISEDGLKWKNSQKPLTSKEQFHCLHHNFVVLVAEDLQPLPMNLNFKGFSKDAASSLINLLYRTMTISKKPMFSQIFTISSEPRTHKNNDFLVKTVQPRGEVTKEQYDFAKTLYSGIKKSNITVESNEDAWVAEEAKKENVGGDEVEID